jgi:DNA mismatch repair ATPase MutS
MTPLVEKIKSIFLDKETREQLQFIQNFTVESETTETSLDAITSHLDKFAQVQTTKSLTVVGTGVYQDVEVFDTYTSEEALNTVFNTVNKCRLKGGQHYLKNLLKHPLHSVELLRARQNLVMDMQKHHANIVEILSEMKEVEQDVLWVYKQVSESPWEDLYDIVYFKTMITRVLNQSPLTLSGYNFYRIIVSPLVGILSPIIYFIVPYLVVRYKLKMNISFFSYIKLTFAMLTNGIAAGSSAWMSKLQYISWFFSLFFYFQGIMNSVEISSAVYKVAKIITEKVSGFEVFMKHASTLCSSYWKPDIAKLFFNAEHNTTFETIFPQAAKKSFTIFSSSFGDQLCLFKSLKREDYDALVFATYSIDCIASILTCNMHHAFSLPTYADTDTPTLQCTGIYHPCIKRNVVVSNDITFGGDTTRCVILTGPNAGGKSTLLKSVLVNILLSQTLCISNSSNTTITPFKYVNSHIHVPDCKGKESLFEAEMYRCKHNLETIASMSPNEHAFIALDEIFNSTNPVEGIAASYAVLKHMAGYANVCSMISTHFIFLTKLSATFPLMFRNVKMNVETDSAFTFIKYPYKLQTGVSRQYIALELLKLNHFDEDIINNAIEIKEKLTTVTKKENVK